MKINMGYNDANSTPRKDFGVRSTHECPNCGHKFIHRNSGRGATLGIICGNCREYVKGEELITLTYEDGQ